MGDNNSPAVLTTSDGAEIAYHRSQPTGDSPGAGVVFLGGFMSDMTGTKATALEAHLQSRGQAFLRFDYQGHGQSSGRFDEGTIGIWSRDALAVIDQLTEGPQILVGSSMGGWIALLCALVRPERVAGLVGIAAAPDFTESMWQGFEPAVRRQIEEEGLYLMPSDYSDEPYVITRALIEDGRSHSLLTGAIAVTCPVRLIQGTADSAVPWETALKISDRLESGDVEVTLIKDGDHRLSEPHDLQRLFGILDALSDRLPSPAAP